VFAAMGMPCNFSTLCRTTCIVIVIVIIIVIITMVQHVS
jgi:hypothetical protein